MPLDFQFKEPPLALRIPKGRPWYGMDILWNRPIRNFLETLIHCMKVAKCLEVNKLQCECMSLLDKKAQAFFLSFVPICPSYHYCPDNFVFYLYL